MVDRLVGNYPPPVSYKRGFSGGSDGKEFSCNAGSLTPGLGRSPGEEKNGNPLQYSCLSNGEGHGQRSLAGYSPWGHKEWERTEQLTVSLSL